MQNYLETIWSSTKHMGVLVDCMNKRANACTSVGIMIYDMISFITTMRLPGLQFLCRLFFGKTLHRPGLSAPLQPRFGSLRLLAIPKGKIAVKSEEICQCDGHTVHKVIQRRLTAEWLAPRESDCSRMHSKVFSDWLPSYTKATRPVLEIFKMAKYFPDRPRIY
jgi:hypothetical protein